MTAKKGKGAPYEAGDDQLFRELIPEFSADFVRLTLPDVARQLDLSAIEFRLCEYFSDSPRGGRPRRPDLVGVAPELTDPARLGALVTRSALRVACLRRIVDARRLTESQRFKLFNFVVSCIESDQVMSDEYDELIRREQEVEGPMIDWAKKRRYEGYVEGLEEGQEKGLEEGRRETLQAALTELKDLVLGLVTQRFGSTPPKLARWISSLESLQELTALAKRVLVVDSPEDLMLREEAV